MQEINQEDLKRIYDYFNNIFEKENFTTEDCNIWIEAVNNNRTFLTKKIGYYWLSLKKRRVRKSLRRRNIL